MVCGVATEVTTCTGDMVTVLNPSSDPYPPTQALMSLFVLSSKDGWVNIMYDGLDAVGIDQQVSKAGTIFMGDLEQKILHVFGTGAGHLRNLPPEFLTAMVQPLPLAL